MATKLNETYSTFETILNLQKQKTSHLIERFLLKVFKKLFLHNPSNGLAFVGSDVTTILYCWCPLT